MVGVFVLVKMRLIRQGISPARVAQLIERLPSKAMDLGLIPGRGYDPAVGCGDIMFK